MANIQDFGEKIGGARKDQWKKTGLTIDFLADMTELERETHVTKDNVWPRPNWENVIADGTPQVVAYWQNEMRKAIPPKPYRGLDKNMENYVRVVSSLRDDIMSVRTLDEVKNFYDNVIKAKYTHVTSSYGQQYTEYLPETNGVFISPFLRMASPWIPSLENKAKKALFGIPKSRQAYVKAMQQMSVHSYDGEAVTLTPPEPGQTFLYKLTVKEPGSSAYYYVYPENTYLDSAVRDSSAWKKDTYFVIRDRKPVAINFAAKEAAEAYVEAMAEQAQELENALGRGGIGNRKKNFVPPQLQSVQYTGPKYRGIRPATGDMYLNDLQFRAGEFGNWMSRADRQTSLNMGYDALRNLADLLQISKEDISFNGTLAIAFGARGTGGAQAGAAHYEPERQVINLTKMSGAGCLAHEWGHALDHAIGNLCGCTGLATDSKGKGATRPFPRAFTNLRQLFLTKCVPISPEEQAKRMEKEISHEVTNLTNWIDSVRPKNLPEPAAKAWDETKAQILAHPEAFTGQEYVYSGKHPLVEQLSQIRKTFTNHVVPMEAKKQIVLWARDLQYAKKKLENNPTTEYVKTDFYNGSKEFDAAFSKSGQGYWASDCELFARAFDCYIADKLKEQGIRSDYLTSHADSFSFTRDGETYYAFPRGEERKAINAAFDDLIRELKELEVFHEAPAAELAGHETGTPTAESRHTSSPDIPSKPVRYEQLSFDELLADASARAGKGSVASRKQNEFSR